MGLREENEKIQRLCEMSVVSDGPQGSSRPSPAGAESSGRSS